MTPSTDWREIVPDGEEAELEALSRRVLLAIEHSRARRPGPARALHAKPHVALVGQLTVDDGLPEHARQGLFARPGRHRAYVRLSNGGFAHTPDRAPDVRGMAVKILGVEGEKILGQHATQDLLAIDAVRTPVRTPREFIAAVEGAASGKLLGTLVRAMGVGGTLATLFRVVRDMKGRPNDLLDVTFNTVLPIAFGPYAARVAFAPRHAPSPARPKSASRDFIRERISERAAREPLRWEVRAQFHTGPETPIEDPTVDWPSPYQRLGELETVPLDLSSPAGRALAERVEQMSFDPWHALREHRPLGAMMRARKQAYFFSTQARGASPEPEGSEWASFLPGAQAA